MKSNGRPIGVWLATAYLFVLFALGVLYLVAAIDVGDVRFILQSAVGVLIALASVVLLAFRSRWVVPVIGVLAALQATPHLAYLATDGATFVAVRGSDAVMRAYLIAYNFGPLLILITTLSVLLYAGWLWHTGILK